MSGQYAAKIKEFDEKIERLEERYINDEIKADLYQKYQKKYTKEKEEMQSFLRTTSFTASNLEEYIEMSIKYCWKLPSTWDSSDFGERLKIQKRVFPEGFYYNCQPRTTKVNPVFSHIARLEGVSEESETGSAEDKFKNSGLVVPTGIEPVSKV